MSSLIMIMHGIDITVVQEDTSECHSLGTYQGFSWSISDIDIAFSHSAIVILLPSLLQWVTYLLPLQEQILSSVFCILDL